MYIYGWTAFLPKPKKHFLSIFRTFWVLLTGLDVFSKMALFQKSIFLLYDYPTSCKKLEKTQAHILKPCIANGRMDEQMNRALFIEHLH